MSGGSKRGENRVVVDCRNGTGPAGLVGRLKITTDAGEEDAVLIRTGLSPITGPAEAKAARLWKRRE